MSKIENIKGVPVEDCQKFIWYVISKLRICRKSAFDEKDLSQIAMLYLLDYSKAIKKDKSWLRHPFVYKSLRWYLSKYLASQISWFRVTQYGRSKYFSLLKSSDPKYLNEDMEKEKLDIYELYNDDKINIKDRNILEDFCKTHKYPISLEKATNPGIRESGLTSLEDTVKTDNSFLDLDGGILEEFKHYMENSPDLSDRDRKLFRYYHGLGFKRKSGSQLSKMFKLDRNSIYRELTRIKKILLKPDGWIEHEFGKKLTDKLRSNYEINKN